MVTVAAAVLAVTPLLFRYSRAVMRFGFDGTHFARAIYRASSQLNVLVKNAAFGRHFLLGLDFASRQIPKLVRCFRAYRLSLSGCPASARFLT